MDFDDKQDNTKLVLFEVSMCWYHHSVSNIMTSEDIQFSHINCRTLLQRKLKHIYVKNTFPVHTSIFRFNVFWDKFCKTQPISYILTYTLKYAAVLILCLCVMLEPGNIDSDNRRYFTIKRKAFFKIQPTMLKKN